LKRRIYHKIISNEFTNKILLIKNIRSTNNKIINL